MSSLPYSVIELDHVLCLDQVSGSHSHAEERKPEAVQGRIYLALLQAYNKLPASWSRNVSADKRHLWRSAPHTGHSLIES